MTTVSTDMIKELRERTGAGMADCKKALVECEASIDKAIDYLRKKGLAKAAKKAGRIATEGVVNSYIHGNGRIGVLLETNCETDFVARSPDFVAFGREVAMQIAAMNPQFVSVEEVPADLVEKERGVARGKVEEEPEERVIHVSSGGDGPRVEIAQGGSQLTPEASATPDDK